MSEPTDRKGSNVRSLIDAVRRVRIAEADRSDVVVELREAERARLDMLVDELKSVFAEIPAEDDQFILNVVAGNEPRLWIDATSFVILGRDRRTYRFLKDTRLGRTVLVETADIDDVADCITTYIAERIIERERAIEGDWLIKRLLRDEGGRRLKFLGGRRRSWRIDPKNHGWLAAAFLLGILFGLVGLLTYAWLNVPA
jgi:hypothetical protein